MKDNFPLPNPIAMSVVPTPIVLFTHEDATRAASLTPAKPRADCDNILAVGAITDVKMMKKNTGNLIVTHYLQSRRTGKQKIAGSWAVGVRIIGTDCPHIFAVMWPEEKKEPTPCDGPLIIPAKGPVEAHV